MVAVLAPVRLVQVPYDSGHFDTRMGAGPLALARAGAAQRLRQQGRAVEEEVLEPASAWQAELRTGFELQRSVAKALTAAQEAGQVPLVLAGNCNTTLGVLASLTATGRRVGLVWLDAHADFNTPELDSSGSLDGQALAMAVGHCWQAATATLPGFTPLPEQHVILIGARNLDSAEKDVLSRSALTWLPPAQARDTTAVARALDALADRVDVVHVHVDLDVYDPSIAPANSYAAPDGLAANEVQQIVRLAADRLPIAAATLASYDPAYDPDGRMRDTALDLLELLVDVATATHRDTPPGL